MTAPTKAKSTSRRRLHPLTTSHLDECKFDDINDLDPELILFPEFNGGANGAIYLYNSHPLQVIKLIVIDDPKKDSTATPIIDLKREVDINQQLNDEYLCGSKKIWKIKAGDETDKYINKRSDKKLRRRDKIIMLMDFFPCSLDSYFNGRTNVVYADAVGIMHEILSGIDRAHRIYKFVHRDIKPKNILFSMAGGIKIVDHGIAKPTTETNDMHTAMKGTITFMCPKVFVGEPYNESTDIFSSGIVFGIALGHKFDRWNYTQFNKYKDFIASSQLVKLKQYLNVNNNIDNTLKKMVINMVSMEPNERDNCEELIDKLNEYMKQNDINTAQLRINRKETVRNQAKKELMNWYFRYYSIKMKTETISIKNKLLNLMKPKLNDETQEGFVEMILDMVDPEEEWIADDLYNATNFESICQEHVDSICQEQDTENVNNNTKGLFANAWSELLTSIEIESKKWSDDIIAKIRDNEHENSNTDNKIDDDNVCDIGNKCDDANMNINKNMKGKKKKQSRKRKKMDDDDDEQVKKKRKIDPNATL